MPALQSAGPVPGGARRTSRFRFLAAALLASSVGVAAASAGKVQDVYAPHPTRDCDRCNVQASFAEKIRACSSAIEFIELKNGIGVVYSTSDARDAARIQKAAEWARAELQRISDDPDRYHLCAYCKATRPIYSKVDREVVRTARGTIFFMRSQDPEAVRALKDMLLKRPKSDTNTRAPSR
jgi:hypothetical protein